MLCGLQGDQEDHKLRTLEDSILFVQAQKAGFTILTDNASDLNDLWQLNPAGRAPLLSTTKLRDRLAGYITSRLGPLRQRFVNI